MCGEGAARSVDAEAGVKPAVVRGQDRNVHLIQNSLYLPVSDEKELSAMGLEQLVALTAGLQATLRERLPSGFCVGLGIWLRWPFA